MKLGCFTPNVDRWHVLNTWILHRFSARAVLAPYLLSSAFEILLCG